MLNLYTNNLFTIKKKQMIFTSIYIYNKKLLNNILLKQRCEFSNQANYRIQRIQIA